MRRWIVALAVTVAVVGCSGADESTGGNGGTAGTGGSGGTAGMAGTGGTGGTGGSAGTGGEGGSGGADLCNGVDCDDGNECTRDVCDADAGACSNTPAQDNAPCDAPQGYPGECTAGRCFGLCVEVNCDDDNECTQDICDRGDGSCDAANRPNGSDCDFGGLPGVCSNGSCVDAELCADVICDDGNECTDDVCNPNDASCSYPNKPDDSLCDAEGYPGLCESRVCKGLCDDVSCDDGNECTSEVCDPNTGSCSNPDRPDGTTCDFGALPGRCSSGLCVGLCSGVNCDDDNECTSDSCDSSDGLCDYVAAADGTGCVGDAGMCTGGRCTVTETIACPEYNLTAPQEWWGFAGPGEGQQYYAHLGGCSLPPYGDACAVSSHVGTGLTYTDHRVEGRVTLLTAKVCNQTDLLELYDTIGVDTPVCLDVGQDGVSTTACHTWYPPLFTQPDGDNCVSVPVDGELTPHGLPLTRVRDPNGIGSAVFDIVDVACGLSTWAQFLASGDYLAFSMGTVGVTYELAPPVISLRALRLCYDIEAACGFGTAFSDLGDCGETITAEWSEDQIATSEAAVIEAETFPVTYCPIVWTGVEPP